MPSSPVALGHAQLRKVRALSQPGERDASDAGGEINVVPFLDIIVNVLMFVVATLPMLFGATITSTPGSREGERVKDGPPLQLSVLITSDGLSLKTSAGSIGPGCGVGGGTTIPKRDGAYDWPALTTCATKLKRAMSDGANETGVRLIAEPAIDYQTLVFATDALRETRDGATEPLFPDVSFGVVR